MGIGGKSKQGGTTKGTTRISFFIGSGEEESCNYVQAARQKIKHDMRPVGVCRR